MPSVLFICTANICRSPMAMALFRNLAGNDWLIESAGTWAAEGQPAAEGAAAEMAARGLDLSTHRSRCVSRELIQPFNLILTMERGHKEALQVEFSEMAERVFLLSEMSGKLKEVDDPYGGTAQDYQVAAQTIEDFLVNGSERIKTLAQD